MNIIWEKIMRDLNELVKTLNKNLENGHSIQDCIKILSTEPLLKKHPKLNTWSVNGKKVIFNEIYERFQVI